MPDADLEAVNQALHKAIDARRSDVWLTGQGRLIKALPDDTHGSQHQRLLLAIGRRRTLLIAHNIDLAPRVPIGRGDLLRFRGEYEFNAKGGVVHWTHHDPGGRRQGGWLEVKGKRYR